MTQAIGDKVRTGVKLTLTTTIASGLLQVGLLIVLARLLGPGDYGYYAAALAISNVTAGLAIGVIERALIVSAADRIEDRGLPAMILAIASIVALATFALCAVIAASGRSTIAPGVLATLLIAQVVASLGVVPRVRLRRRLLFGRIATGELASQFVAGAGLAILLAANGWGALGLALTQVAGNLIIVATVARGTGVPFARFRLRELAGLMRSAGQLGRIAALEMGNAQLPTLMLTFLAGPAALGLFNRAYNVVQLPVQLLTTSMTRVMISALVAVGDERERLRTGMHRLVQYAAAMVTPVACGIAGSNRAFTAVILSPKWAAAAPLMPLLAIGTWTVMIGYLFSVLSEATRHFAEKVRIQIASSSVLLIGIIVGSGAGLMGVSAAIALAGSVFLLLYLRLGARILDLSARRIASWMLPGLVAGTMCGTANWAMDRLLALPSLELLALQILADGTIAVVYYLLFHRPLLLGLATAILPARLGSRLA